jgi:hypothetical protein
MNNYLSEKSSGVSNLRIGKGQYGQIGYREKIYRNCETLFRCWQISVDCFKKLLCFVDLTSAGQINNHYAVFHACIALFEFYHYTAGNFIGRNGRPSTRWEHGIITKYVLLEFVRKRNLIDWTTAAQIKRLYRSRIEADYRSDLIIAEALARNSYAEAVKIVHLVRGKVK